MKIKFYVLYNISMSIFILCNFVKFKENQKYINNVFNVT